MRKARHLLASLLEIVLPRREEPTPESKSLQACVHCHGRFSNDDLTGRNGKHEPLCEGCAMDREEACL